MFFSSKVDSTVEEIVGQEDLSQDIMRQQELTDLVKDNMTKGHEKKGQR